MWTVDWQSGLAQPPQPLTCFKPRTSDAMRQLWVGNEGRPITTARLVGRAVALAISEASRIGALRSGALLLFKHLVMAGVELGAGKSLCQHPSRTAILISSLVLIRQRSNALFREKACATKKCPVEFCCGAGSPLQRAAPPTAHASAGW